MNFGVLILSSASAVYIKEHTIHDGSDRNNNDDRGDESPQSQLLHIKRTQDSSKAGIS